MKTVAHLDWLSVTFSAAFQQEILEAYVGKLKLVGAGSHGYSERWTARGGAILLAGGSAKQGKSVTFPGTALQDIRAVTSSDLAILGLCRAHRGKASRVDLAIDVFESGLKIADFWAEIQKGNIITHATAFKAIDDVGPGVNTLYVGSRHSDKFMRIYNKALEQDIDNLAWVRLELQCRRLVARSYVEGMSKMQEIRPFINRAIDEFASFPTLDEYRAVVADDDAEIPVQGRTPPAFWRWIASQVVPSMVTRQVEYPEEDVLMQVTKLFIKQLHERGPGRKPNDPLLDNED